ncbi:copper chaperone PCu(A)C [Rothia sp. AR01]|uniref:Copper chaperone PCu(A)C n=1 Tax=Rothia santali TaxID=2949643 RepID=A0A9X2HFJ9_9MICC|nr:copper chaperone PCu(A)C [Rothia santali]MCP3426379.1 copper chaperone PCu(A)C [Rothia santali]
MTAFVSARRLSAATLALTAALTLAACGSAGEEQESAGSNAPASSDPTGLSVSDPWVKSADSGMTAAFGTLTNDTDHTVTIESVSSEASPEMQLHETVMDDSGVSTMREKSGGFAIEPGASLTLEPGGDHFMFMGLTCSLMAGDDAEVTVTTDDGSQLSFEAPIRDYQAAQENYDPSAEEPEAGAMDHSEHDMDGMDHSQMEGMDHSDMEGMDRGGEASATPLPSCGQ